MDDNQKGLLYLFERPFELLKAPRANGMIQFQQTVEEDEAYDNPSVAMEESSDTRYGPGAMVLNIPKLNNILDQMEMLNKVPKGVPYSHFDPVHIGAVKELTTLFMEYVDKPNYWQYAGAVKESVNEGIFIFALSFVIIRADELHSRLLPAIYEVFPNMFISQHTMDKCREKVIKSDSKKDKIEVDDKEVDFSGSDRSLEHRLTYWREDYGMNAHHWHWHLVFGRDTGNDRKGEVFYYMHNQMLARYDWERLSNGVSRVVPLDNWHEPIPEGYFPDLTIDNTFNHWGGRPDNMTLLKDHNRRRRRMDTARLKIRDDIQNGCMENDNGETIQLTDSLTPCKKLENGEKEERQRGIDILGDILEYGLHNDGHVCIGQIHDPEGHHGLWEKNPGVMTNPTVAMRDPVFYRWHKFIDDIFQDYKMKQEPYEDKELVYGPVQLESVSVKMKSGELDDNVLETGWSYREIEVTRGIDFGPSNFDRTKPDSIVVKSRHLNHNEFLYNLEVTNNETEPLDVTVRLYMAPKYNEKGDEMTYMDQRQLWAEMDRYEETLEPGLNSLERSSMDSSITILAKNTFRDLEDNPPMGGEPSAFCGCGWPQHLLLPKGTVEGMDFQIFALISCLELDECDGSAGKKTCSKAASYCGGSKDEKYPDARPMGYPFDRRTNDTVNGTNILNVADLATALPNAVMSGDIKINFTKDEIVPIETNTD